MCKIEDFIMLLFLLWCSISDLRTKKIPTVLLIIMSLTVIMIRLIFIRQEIAGMAGGALMGAILWLISKYTNQADWYEIAGFLEIWEYIWEVSVCWKLRQLHFFLQDLSHLQAL